MNLAQRSENRQKKAGNNKKTNRVRNNLLSIDIPFLVLVLVLLAFGLVMLFSASYVSALKEYGNSFHYFNNQLRNAILGIILMFAAAFVKIKLIEKLTPAIMIVNLGLLLMVLAYGIVGGGAKRWIMIGSFNFQPSEITKIAVILFIAYYVSKNLSLMRNFKKGMAPILLVIGINAVLVLLERHISGTILIVGVSLILLFIGGVPFKYFLGAGVAVGGAMVYIIRFTDYAKARVNAWLNPFVDIRGAAYQTVQSLYAIGSGGILGLGLGNSVQKHLYLPEAHNDFIFAIVCEELGFIGAVLVILLFALLIWRGFTIALHTSDTFSRLVVIGIMSLITLQFVLNIAVVSNLIPVTGISLPFFSYGGTALIIMLVEMGIVLNVSRYSLKTKR